jgi:hypothetical protein
LVVAFWWLAQGHPGAQPLAPGQTSAASIPLLGDRLVMHVSVRSSPGQARAFRFRASASGTADTAHVYLGRSDRATALFVALYSDARGHPGKMLAVGVRKRRAVGWVRVGVHRAPITGGRTYWLALLGTGGTLVYRVRHGHGCHGLLDHQTRLRRPPARWAAGRTSAGCSPSAFVSGSPAAARPPGTPNSPAGPGTTTSPTTPGGTPPVIPAGGCFASPGVCGYPDPAYHNVGPTSACSALTASGTITATTAGEAIANVNVSGRIIVAAANVTINNVCVTYNGQGQLGSSAIYIQGSANNTLIEHATIAGANDSTESTEQAIANTSSGSATATDDYIYNCGECVWGGPWTLSNSYVITNGMQGTSDHLEDLYCSDETVTLTHDTLLDPADQNSVIFCDTHYGDGGPCDNHISITNGLLAGGGFVIYTCGNASSAGSSTMTITGNRFARCTTGPFKYNSSTGGTACQGATGSSIGAGADSHGYWPQGGYFGIAKSVYCPPTAGQAWSSNVWDDNGAAVSC